MAKRGSSSINWHKKQVSTRNGIMTLAFLIVVTIILIPVLGQWQNSSSNAATTPGVGAACKVNGVPGTCKLTSSGPGNAAFYPGHCPGASNVQCLAIVGCSTPEGDGACLPVGSKSTGAFIPGHCPGPSNIECWVGVAKSSGGGTAGTSGSAGCTALGGTCQNKSAHVNGEGGLYHSGYCPGSSNVQCWVPEGKDAATCGAQGMQYCSLNQTCMPVSSTCNCPAGMHVTNIGTCDLNKGVTMD